MTPLEVPDLSNAELTQFVRVHNAAIAHHEQEIAQIRTILAEVAKGQAQNQAQQAINTQEIANLTASMLDLRTLVADSLKGRSETH